MDKSFSILALVFSTSITFGQINVDTTEILRFANSLEKGEKYSGKYVHPFTGDTLERKIEGIVKDKCIYLEQMPNGGRLLCHYKIEDLKKIAQYYRSTVGADSMSTSVQMKLGVDSMSRSSVITTVKSEINGEEVVNPLQECLGNGDCVIEGYGAEKVSVTISVPVGGSMSMNDLAFTCKKENDIYIITVELVNHSCKPVILKNPIKEVYKCKDAEYQFSIDLKSSTDFIASIEMISKK